MTKRELKKIKIRDLECKIGSRGGCMTATEKDIKKRPSPAVQEMDALLRGVIEQITKESVFHYFRKLNNTMPNIVRKNVRKNVRTIPPIRRIILFC